jgi:thioredoxin-related protein/YHS domain-containing protein
MPVRRSTLLACMFVLFFAAPGRAEDLIPWSANLEQAQDVAARRNQLVLLHFTSDNCAPCRALEQNVFSRDQVARAVGDKFVPVKINVDQRPDLARKYNVDRWPTDVIITPAGYAVHSMTSPQDANQYISQLNLATQRGLVAHNSAAGPTANGAGAYGAANPYGAGKGNISQSSPMSRPPEYSDYFEPLPGYNQQPAATWDGARGYGAATPAGNIGADTGAHDPLRRPVGPQYSQGSGPYADQARMGPAAAAPNPFGTTAAPPARVGNPGVANYPDHFGPPAQNWQDNQRAAAGPGGYGPPAGTSPGLAQERVRAGDAWSGPGYTPNGAVSPPAGPLGSAHGPTGHVPNQPPAAASPAGHPPIGLDSYCPVTLLGSSRWTKGDVRWGAIHRGRTYLFVGEDEQRKFLSNPDLYSPMLSGYDPVMFTDAGQLVDGNRKHGVVYQKQVFLFVDEASLERFWHDPQRYATAARMAMQQSAAQPPR